MKEFESPDIAEIVRPELAQRLAHIELDAEGTEFRDELIVIAADASALVRRLDLLVNRDPLSHTATRSLESNRRQLVRALNFLGGEGMLEGTLAADIAAGAYRTINGRRGYLLPSEFK
jgi:hypothetical protein